MSVPFISRKRLNPLDLDAEVRHYPAAAYIAEIGVNQIAEEISQTTSLTPAEVIGIIRSLLLIVPRYLLLGYKVRLDSFGCSGWGSGSRRTARDTRRRQRSPPATSRVCR